MATYDIFISYSRKDTAIINPVLDYLKQQGYSLWIDTEGKYHSEKFRGKIVKAIKGSKCLLFFSSKNSNDSEWVRREINVADEEHKVIIPYLLDNSGYDDEIRLTLTGVEHIDSTETSLKKCLNYLNDTLGRLTISPSSDTLNEDRTSKPEKKKFPEWLIALFIIVGAFIGVYGLCFGIGYGIERFTSGTNHNQQAELNLHATYYDNIICYSNNGLVADYNVSTNQISVTKDSLYYEIKSEDLWRAASLSSALYLWGKNLKHIPGNGKTKIGVAVASFFGVLFGYSQGMYLASIHNMQEVQDSMETYLQDSENWVYLKQSYLKRKKLFNE